jgi:hypothetical protein
VSAVFSTGAMLIHHEKSVLTYIKQTACPELTKKTSQIHDLHQIN